MPSIELLLIVNMLKESWGVVIDPEEFCDNLGVPPNIKVKLLNRNQNQISDHGCIDKVLMNWISRNGSNSNVGRLLRVFGKMGNTFCADALEDLIASLGIEPPFDAITIMPIQEYENSVSIRSQDSVSFGITSQVFNFQGREKELDELWKLYTNTKYPGVLISGLGGIGKTQLTKKFISEMLSKNDQITIAWLAGESYQTLRTSLTGFAQRLSISLDNCGCGGGGGEAAEIQILEAIVEKLKSRSMSMSTKRKNPRHLVVIDNADEEHDLFQTTAIKLLSLAPSCFLIVTSRRRDIFPGQLELLAVSPLKMEDAMEFIKSSLSLESLDSSQDEVIRKLCDFVETLPLALQQVVAFIRQRRRKSLKSSSYGVEEYLNELKINENRGFDTPTGFEGYSKTLLNVWDVTLNSIFNDYEQVGKIAVELMQILAYLFPDEIPVNLIEILYPAFFNRLEQEMEDLPLNLITDGLELLVQYSLINCGDDDGHISVHRLTQLVIRYKMRLQSNKNKTKTYYVVDVVQGDVETLSKFWESDVDGDVETVDHFRHMISIKKHSAKHPELVSSFPRLSSDTLESDEDEVSEHFKTFPEFLSVNHKLMVEVLGGNPDSWEVGLGDLGDERANNGILEMEKRQDDNSLAICKLKELFKTAKCFLGDANAFTILIARRLSKVLVYCMRYEESLEWAQVVLKSRVELYQEDGTRVNEAKEAMADILLCLNRVEEARKFYEEVLEWRRINLDVNDPEILKTSGKLAQCSQKQ